MGIIYREVFKEELDKYDAVEMNFMVKSLYRLKNKGLQGFELKEEKIDTPYIKDYRKYNNAVDYDKKFDITNWRFFMAFDDLKPVGGATLVMKTKGVYMLDFKENLGALWDIRINNDYKNQGIGSKLFDMVKNCAKSNGLKELKIETQNVNVPACKFYSKQGAKLKGIREQVYQKEEQEEIQFLFYLDL
ncbi:MAG: TDP-fucosamine acetyltransferase [Alphaproteobacteria bacterium ADurb.Bin438]|nr:MAG: TDP-fucosamine acetyltransferase [Alphaproteobacteria bacterium ADurb.Bin438]